MSESPSQALARKEMNADCIRLVALTALEASEAMTTSKRIMIHHGIAAIFPNDSPEHEEAKQAAYALSTAEKKQLTLFQRLNQQPAN